MEIRTDTAADHAAAARTLLSQVAAGQFTSLATLSGADLCILGGARHPVCW